jgi:hypothetical protein
MSGKVCKMRDILVIVVVKPDGDDLNFRVIVPERSINACSPIMTVKRGPAGWGGNPYGVYGNQIAGYLGCEKNDVSISVAKCDSGEL